MSDDKLPYAVGSTGHINLMRIKDFSEREKSLRSEIFSHFKRLREQYAVTLYCGLANGADSVFAEEALKCGVELVAVLPEDRDRFMNEQQDRALFLRLLKRASRTILCPNGYVGVMEQIIAVSDEIFTLWDGVELPLTDGKNRAINRGGTYDCIRTARLASKKIRHFNQIRDGE